jgi:4-cresol dehydrogenase (hydroxylating)
VADAASGVVRAFFFTFPDHEDLGEIIDLVRPLKLNNVVPPLIKMTSDL